MLTIINKTLKDVEGSGSWSELRYYPDIWMERLRKTTQNVSQKKKTGVPVGDRIGHVGNTNQKCYRLSKLRRLGQILDDY